MKTPSESYLESPKQYANLSPVGHIHNRAFTPVYLPRKSPRNFNLENSPQDNLRIKFHENPRIVFGGTERLAVMNNTLSYKVESILNSQVQCTAFLSLYLSLTLSLSFSLSIYIYIYIYCDRREDVSSMTYPFNYV